MAVGQIKPCPIRVHPRVSVSGKLSATVFSSEAGERKKDVSRRVAERAKGSVGFAQEMEFDLVLNALGWSSIELIMVAI